MITLILKRGNFMRIKNLFKSKRLLVTITVALIGIICSSIVIFNIVSRPPAEKINNAYVKPAKKLQHKSISQVQKKIKTPKAFTNTAASHNAVSNQSMSELLENRATALKAGMQNHQAGYVRIPSVSITERIYQGTNSYTLSLGATTYFNNEVMGQGNYVLAGHNMDVPGVLFSNLVNVKKGSLVYLIDSAHSYKYRIDTVKEISKKIRKDDPNSLFYQSPSHPTVTLFTCNATGSMRIVAHGHLI